MCQQFQAENGLLALETDVAKMNQVRRGHFVMNIIVTCDTPVSGPSILSCAPSQHTTPSATLARLQTQFELNSMSSDDVMLLSSQKMHIPTDHMGLIEVFEHYDKLLERLFTTDSHTFKVTHKFLEDLISTHRQSIGHLIAVNGPSFCFSLLANIHIAMASYINKCFTSPSLVTKEDLNFDELARAIRLGNFMNLFNLPYSSKPSSKHSNDQEEENENDRSASLKRKRKEKEKRENRRNSRKVINSFGGTQTGMSIRKFMQGRQKYDPEKTKCPKVAGTEACLKWFQRGQCTSDCARKDTHIELAGGLLQKVKSYIKACEDKANASENQTTEG